MRKLQKLLISAFLTGIACACQAQPIADQKVASIKICPEGAEEDIKSVLNIESLNDHLSLQVLLDSASENGYNFEQKRYGVTRYKCPETTVLRDTQVYFIYGGFDKNREYTRDFVAITNSADQIEAIEVRRAYVAPGG